MAKSNSMKIFLDELSRKNGGGFPRWFTDALVVNPEYCKHAGVKNDARRVYYSCGDQKLQLFIEYPKGGKRETFHKFLTSPEYEISALSQTHLYYLSASRKDAEMIIDSITSVPVSGCRTGEVADAFMNSFWKDEAVKKSIDEYNWIRPVDMRLNAFVMTAGQNEFCKEKFHSSIIADLLNAENEAEEDAYFIRCAFLCYLKDVAAQRNPQCAKSLKCLTLTLNDVFTATPEQPTRADRSDKKGFIDILVEIKKAGGQKSKAIIIENKINGAPDMERQLPRYYDYCLGKGYDVLAEVYLTANQINAEPSRAGWSENDVENVSKVFLPVAGWKQGDGYSLYEGWIVPVIEHFEHREDEDGKRLWTIFKQYGDLLKKQSESARRDNELDEFLKCAADRGVSYSQLEHSRKYAEIVKSIPARLARFIRDNCLKRDFGKSFVFDENEEGVGAVFDELRIEDGTETDAQKPKRAWYNFKIDVYCKDLLSTGTGIRLYAEKGNKPFSGKYSVLADVIQAVCPSGVKCTPRDVNRREKGGGFHFSIDSAESMQFSKLKEYVQLIVDGVCEKKGEIEERLRRATEGKTTED